MSILQNLEQEYLLGEAKLFREFDSSHFISNAKTAVTNKIQTVNLDMKFDYYTSMLEKAISSFNTINIDKTMVNEFISNVNKIKNLSNYNLTVCEVPSIVDGHFKPQYIQQYINIVGNIIEKTIKNEADSSELLPFISGDYKDKVIRQVIKTNIPYCTDTRTLIKKSNCLDVPVDNNYVNNKVIPFITKFDTIKSNTLIEANGLLEAIRETELTVKGMISVVNKYLESGNIDMATANNLKQVSYNSIRSIIEIVSFIAFLMVRQLNNIGTQIVSFEELYVDICNIISASGNVTEAFTDTVIATDSNSLADDLIKGNSDAYTTIANNIYEFHSGMPQAELISNLDFDNSYDKSVYDEVNKAYIVISKGLDIIAASVSDNFLMVFDDIIEKSGFSVRLQDRFRNVINMTTDVSKYTSTVNISTPDNFDYNIYGSMIHEVKDFGANMDTIARNILDVKTKIDMLTKRFESNVNGEFSDSEAVNELKIFMKDLNEQLEVLTNEIATGFMKRLKTIGETLTEVESLGKTPETTTDVTPVASDNCIDYAEEAFKDELRLYDEETENVFKSLEMSYYAEKARVLRGVNVIFEADNTQPNSGTNVTSNNVAATTNTSSQANNTQVSNSANNNNSTKPIVTDNSGNNANNQGSKSTTVNTSGMVQSINKWIEDKINQFIDLIAKQGDAKNKKWIALNKDNLLNRSYNNVAIKILPYNNMPTETIFADIKSVSNSIKSLNPQVLQSIKTQDDLYKKLFPSMGGLSGDNISDQIKNYYKTKTISQSEMVTIANGNLKTFVSDQMIPYCEKYYNDFGSNSSSLRNALKELSTSVENTLNAFNTSTKTESVNIFTEANDNNQNKEASLSEKANWITTAIKYYSGSILNALRERNKDYLNALNALVPKNTQQSSQTQQSNQGQQQQNNTDNNQNTSNNQS